MLNSISLINSDKNPMAYKKERCKTSFAKTCLMTLKILFQMTTLQVLACDEYLYPVLLFRLLLSLLFACTGMDARVAYGFHHLRNEKPNLAQGPLSNKV